MADWHTAALRALAWEKKEGCPSLGRGAYLRLARKVNKRDAVSGFLSCNLWVWGTILGSTLTESEHRSSSLWQGHADGERSREFTLRRSDEIQTLAKLLLSPDSTAGSSRTTELHTAEGTHLSAPEECPWKVSKHELLLSAENERHEVQLTNTWGTKHLPHTIKFVLSTLILWAI